MADARYHRQTLLPAIGTAGQRLLGEASVFVAGCGALGSVSAEMLARAGVGRLVLVDRDIVEVTNLQRQVLYDERDVADRLPKAEAARRRLAAINSSVDVEAIVDDINRDNIETLVAGADIIVDGLDNFETRYLLNDVAVKHGLPYLYAGAVGTQGMLLPILPRGASRWSAQQATPCFRCLFPEAPPPGTTPSCDTAGVLGPVVSIMANLQVTEAIKFLTGNLDAMRRKLLQLDPWHNEIIELKVAGRLQEDCPCCGQRRFDYLDGQAGSSADVLCGRNAIQIRARDESHPVNLADLARRLEHHGRVQQSDFMLTAWISDDESDYELTLFGNGRALIKGTQDVGTARSIYARYIGT